MGQMIPLTQQELEERTALNYARLCEPYYQIEQVFSPAEYDWPGDKEGRALLAFICHAQMGRTVPCLAQMIARLDEHTGPKGYFGPPAQQELFEQQLSGHSWYLRGLCAAYEYDADAAMLRRMRQVFEGLYLPTAGRWSSYPLHRVQPAQGGVSGSTVQRLQGWRLSTDVGCAFMSIDGLSHYYTLSRDERALALLREMTQVFAGIDTVALRAQTHCCLSAARGLLRLYETTGETPFLHTAQQVWRTYLRSGMTLAYQNFNWWGRGDTWSEPCAIVDSLIVALWLYELTADEMHLTLARRIWHNGLASAQRPNGGAGCDTTVSESCPVLQMYMYEAPFCCTMRLGEGLLWAARHAAELSAQLEGELQQDAFGRWHDGDILYAQLLDAPPQDLPELAAARTQGGVQLLPLVKFYRLPEPAARAMRQRVRFARRAAPAQGPVPAADTPAAPAQDGAPAADTPAASAPSPAPAADAGN